MKIAVIRGDFLSGWEIPIFEPWLKRHEVTLFLGKKLVGNKFIIPDGFKVRRLFSPVDLNFGTVKRPLMAILNRMFIDAHVLVGLEEELKGFDIAYIAETFYKFSWQAVQAKRKGYVKAVVMHVGENIPFNNEGIWGRKALKREVIANTDKFICITEQAKRVLLMEGAVASRIVRATPGVDLSLFNPRREKQNSRELRGQQVCLLTIGRLVPEKGIREMVEIVERVRNKLRPKKLELKFMVVGKGPEGRWLHKNWITHISQVSYQDMPQIYNSADIYLHFPVGSKTWEEQWGFVLAEAMACGLPIVALGRGSVMEVVRDGGIIVQNAEDFLKGVERLITNQKEREILGKRALRFAEQYYNVQDFSRVVEDVFYQCLE